MAPGLRLLDILLERDGVTVEPFTQVTEWPSAAAHAVYGLQRGGCQRVCEHSERSCCGVRGWLTDSGHVYVQLSGLACKSCSWAVAVEYSAVFQQGAVVHVMRAAGYILYADLPVEPGWTGS